MSYPERYGCPYYYQERIKVMSTYTQIKQAVSVPEAAKHYGHAVTRNGMACCPFHPDHTPSLKLNENYFFCFGCQKSGDVIDFNWETDEAGKIIAYCKILIGRD